MKVNAFSVAQQSNAQLLPMFPYVHRGAIVPCSIAFESDGSGAKMGYFVHTNSVDEIALTLASNGPQRTGDVFVGPRSHGVGGGSTVAFFRVGVVTQRQLEEGEQPEEATLFCEQCNVELLRNGVDMAETNEADRYAPLPSIVLLDELVTQFNASETARTCSACGHVNPPFPAMIWGWSRYLRNSRTAQRGWDGVREPESAR
ncbi:hypothetical protein [Sphingomonas sp. AOB5]|uniref:hypothetical protein n=1 Tax=Sphingomonas sp. AOB5 TaxID=3034017 RepID=UPI0023F6B416|nr:hypothetical protein [Sphingomonas sp. AOB5]